MQRLDFESNEKLTRKEYLKRKKKQAKSLKNFGIRKRKYIFVAVTTILSIYILLQFYFYNKTNSYKYVAGEGVEDQNVYNLYYITEGYTYTPKYTLNSINSDGFDNKVVYDNLGFTNIKVTEKYVYGIKDTGLSRLNKTTNQVENIIEKDVKKYTIFGNTVYSINGDKNTLTLANIETKEVKNTNIQNVCEILVDDNNVFLVIANMDKKAIVSYNKNMENKVEVTKKSNVSYIVQSTDKIFYVNKADSNKIYYVKKDASIEEKVADIVGRADNGNIKEIDGSNYLYVRNNDLYFVNAADNNTLWKINLEDKSTKKIISTSIEIIQNVDNTVFYKEKNNMEVYMYNVDTNFMSQVVRNKISEFYVDSLVVDIKNRNNTQVKN
ncbi:MAG: DUF5050 domain-containing protein [Clostridia bacterium]|nr:DUF5050 domain-containing protein [Clostridia bacterium]